MFLGRSLHEHPDVCAVTAGESRPDRNVCMRQRGGVGEIKIEVVSHIGLLRMEPDESLGAGRRGAAPCQLQCSCRGADTVTPDIPYEHRFAVGLSPDNYLATIG